MRIKWTENAVSGLSSLFSPFGASVSSLMIQQTSHRFSRSLRVSLFTFDISANCFIRVYFAPFIKLWPCISKLLPAGIAFKLIFLVDF